MKYIKLSIILLGILIMTNCSKNNVFFNEWDTPFQTPPFDLISEADYMPALKEGLKLETKRD